MGIFLHQDLIEKNHAYWNQKPLLRALYGDFYRVIARSLSNLPESKIVELGSGLGNIHDVIPSCLRTDLFLNAWIDQVENAYQLSFTDESVSDLILTDVFHHLKYPGTALKEFFRVLRSGGRVIMLEPCLSALGLRHKLGDWQKIETKRISAIAYAASGGFSKPQLYPGIALPLIRKLEKVLGLFPTLFATRLLVILEK
jgi:SAM-dependent methyltransferase